MLKHQLIQKKSSHQRQKDRKGKLYCRAVILIYLFLSGTLLQVLPALAASPTAGTVIDNQGTGSFIDSTDNTEKQVESNIVKVTVAEIAGITISPANTPTAITGSTVNFDFTITNVGNDPTQFFIPDAPSAITGGTAGTLKIVAYDPDGSGSAAAVDLTGNNITVPANGANTGTLLSAIASANNGSIPAGATIVVRVPVTVTAVSGQPVSVTLGNTGGQPSNSNTPYIVGANGTGSKDLYTVDNADGVSNESAGVPINGDAINHRQEASAILTVTVNAVSISGTVFSDADADVTINGSDTGTDAGSGFLTIYAIDTAGKVVDKASVAANGTYSLTNIPPNAPVTLRLSNDNSVAIGSTAPTTPSIPSGWYNTGENLNGTIDPVISTLGDIALTTTTSNLTNENFGIRQAYTIAADAAPTTCNPDYRTALNTGITTGGGQLAVGVNDLNWTAEWIAGPASGIGTPYAPPRPVGTMPAVVVGNLAPGAWVNEPANARWISYPFRLSVNGDGKHNDADLDGIKGEGNGSFSGPGTSDDVRLKFTSTLTLPSNANTLSISLPVGVAIDNQFVSIKVNGVENLVPTPAANPRAADYGTLKTVNITNGWQAGVNTIEVIVDSSPDRVGFFLGVQATSIQVCTKPNVLLVKRITAINGGTTTVGGDSLASYIDSPTNPYDDNNITISTQPTPTDPPLDTDKWPSLNSFMLGGINGGKVKPGDEIEYTIYFLSANKTTANNVLICDRIPDNVTFLPTAFNSFPAKNSSGLASGDRGIIWQYNGVTESLTNAADGDKGEYLAPGVDPNIKYPDIKCDGSNNNGVVIVNLGNVPSATAPGTPINSYGFVRFGVKVK
ncbi:MAG: hypothetical protein V7K32_16835 [Nostoc sp.]|uniref:hypothetical protein n=1 Tax=Nostoc sp. TaxID=1180 RepID=UPI002FF94578